MALSREEVAARYGAAMFGYAKDMKDLGLCSRRVTGS